jgi:hypothetical protein
MLGRFLIAPHCSEVLVLLRQSVSMIFVHGFHAWKGEEVKWLDWRWLVTIAGMGVFSVFMSNIAL